MTFGEKLKKARVEAGYTQEELANIIAVSRAAVAKWESDRGMPDVNNMRSIAATVDVSIDYLMDDGSFIDLSTTKKAIDITKFENGRNPSRLRKIEIKEKIIREEYPEAKIIRLTLTKIKNTKAETVVDNVIGFFVLILGNIPLFGTQGLGKMVNNINQQYYLVNQEKRQYFVLLTDEHIVSKALAERITDKKFEIGDKEFLVIGEVK